MLTFLTGLSWGCFSEKGSKIFYASTQENQNSTKWENEAGLTS